MAANMMLTLRSQKWGAKLGIAGNQGGYPYRVAICLGRFIVNPSFTPTKAPSDKSLEGCYSLGVTEVYEVSRAPYGWLKYQDTKGEWHEEKVKGVLAIVVQHELDHLDGRLCHEGGRKVVPPKSLQEK